MRFARVFSRSRSIGVALDDTGLRAWLPAPGPRNATRVWTRALARAPEAGEWTDLTDALRELRSLVGGHVGVIHLALMPPLGRVRLIELPGVSEKEAARVVRRDPSRFFPVRAARLAVELQGSGWRRLSPFLVAAAPHYIVEQAAAAAAASGWSLGGIAPAQLAWAVLGQGAGPHSLVIRCADHIELLRIARGALIGARRVPLSESASTAESSAQPKIIASESEAAERAAALINRPAGPMLQSESARSAVRRTQRKRAILRSAVAAALLVGAAALELSGLRQERSRVAMERRRIHAAVAQSMAVRESIAVSTERLAALRGVGAASARWSELLATLAEQLPSDAYLVSLTAEGDSVHLEGAALRAAPVFDAVNAISSVRGVRPDGPIRQELRGAEGSEHFVLSAFVRGSGGQP